MFGLSTHEVEMKNVYAAYSNNINIYYESLKDGLTVKLSENIGNFEKLFENSANLYFDSSKDSLFKYLRTQYKDFDIKFENAINDKRYKPYNNIDFNINGFTAGTLFYYVYIAISKKVPKEAVCYALDKGALNLMDEAFDKLKKEINL